MTLVVVFLGGMLGAPTRYLLDRWVSNRHASVFPWGTLAVNLTASFLLGVLLAVATALPGALVPLLATGFCGALSTFSTFAFETLRLLEDGSVLEAGLNALGSLAAGIALAALGWLLGGLFV